MEGEADKAIARHVPVMVEAVLAWMDPRPGQVIVDCTIGEGGHALRILPRIAPGGALLGLDRDGEALAVARKNLRVFEKMVVLEHENFSRLKEAAQRRGWERVDGILFDLGFSSFQLEEPSRGFSFLRAGPLDMRMDRRETTTAADLVNRLSGPELAQIIGEGGEERWARRISRAITQARRLRPISTTKELAAIVSGAVPGRGKIHPATRTFQALRVWLNRELAELRQALPAAFDLLRPGGKICVIAFQSLEDRIVKQTFREWAKVEGRAVILTPRPGRPSPEEVRNNPRCRSARLRAVRKKADGE